MGATRQKRITARIKKARARLSRDHQKLIRDAAQAREDADVKRRDIVRRSAQGKLSSHRLLLKDVMSAVLHTDIAIGITTARRPNGKRVIDASILSLRGTGFRQKIHVFAEPQSIGKSELEKVDNNSKLLQNHTRLGCVGNWRHAAEWLLQKTNASWIMILQDDVVWKKLAGDVIMRSISYLELNKATHEIGFLSPYTSPAMVDARPPELGWYDASRARGFWGALALCLPRQSLQDLIVHPTFTGWRENKKLDVLVARVLRAHIKPNRLTMVHIPSLVDHTGEYNSTVRTKRKITKRLKTNRSGYGYHTIDIEAQCNRYRAQ